jgi:hypothetical protein
VDGRIEDQSALQPYWGNKAAPCPRWSPPFHGDEAVAGSDLNQCPRVLREMLSSDVQGSPTARPAPSPPFVSGGGHGRSSDMGSVDHRCCRRAQSHSNLLVCGRSRPVPAAQNAAARARGIGFSVGASTRKDANAPAQTQTAKLINHSHRCGAIISRVPLGPPPAAPPRIAEDAVASVLDNKEAAPPRRFAFPARNLDFQIS